METYEEWNMTIPAIPSRSRLYRLEPIGIETPYVESLTSYIIRLADAHCVRPDVLITQEIMHSLGKLENIKHNSKALYSLWARNAPMLNGTSQLSNDCVQVLEMLTQFSGLRFLTMMSWTNVIAQRMMLRNTQSWCPACYIDWRETGQLIYNPLIWSLKAVAICPRHRQPLSNTCPYENCQRPQPFIAIGVRIGHCSYCNRWLGSVSKCNRCDDTDVEQLKDKERLYWNATAVGDLIANAPSIMNMLERENVTLAIKTLSERITQGNISYLAHRLGLSAETMNRWQRGADIPQLAQLLQLSFSVGLSLLQILTIESTSSHVLSTTLANKYSSIIKKGRHKGLNPNELRESLEKALLENPPLSLKEVALRLGYRSSKYLSRYFPDFRRAISERYKWWVLDSSSTKGQTRKPLKPEELQKMLEVVLSSEEMPPPSILEVAQRLGYRSIGPIYERFPNLCHSIAARHKEYQEQFNRHLQQSLEAFVKDSCDSIPSLIEIAERLGCSNRTLSSRFPQLCHEITVRHRKRLHKLRQQLLEEIIASDTFPPLSLGAVARQLRCATDTLRRNSPSLCDIIKSDIKTILM